MLAEMASATDPALRALARQLAGRVFVDTARHGPTARRGVGLLRTVPFRADGDIDLDASIEAIVEGRSLGIDVDRLRVRHWERPNLAISLLVDRSGSMGGEPLAAAALAAASVAWRAPSDHSVLAFAKDVVVLRSQDVTKSAESVVDDLLALRGFGTTDLTGALRAAGNQLARSTARRKVVIVLSDCRATVDGDPVACARQLDEVVVIAPASDCAEATSFAERCGARLVTIDGPSTVVAAINQAVDRR